MRGAGGFDPKKRSSSAVRRAAAAAVCAPALLAACSFDYGALSAEAPEAQPDVVMTDVEYVRVRDGKPVVRLQAETLERFEKERRMVADSPRFKQFLNDGADGAVGGASKAVVDLASGDVTLRGGVTLSVPDQKMIIETDELSWKDADRTLRGGADKSVLVKKEDGSYLSGVGFSSDARWKTWELTGAVSGVLTEEDKKTAEDAGDSDAEATDAAEEDAAATDGGAETDAAAQPAAASDPAADAGQAASGTEAADGAR